jgi:hypothetical protein
MRDLDGLRRNIRAERRKVVVEKEHVVVIVGILRSASSPISRTHVAIRIIARRPFPGWLAAIPLPRPSQSTGGAEHPLIEERVVAAVRIVV